MTRTTEALAQGRTPRTDEELLAAVRAQRPDAFPDLRDRHWHTAVVVARLHTPSRQDAEQLAGTSFDQLLAELGDEGGKGEAEDGPGVFLRARLVSVVGRAGVERGHAAETVTGVYLGLPASWQAVLWHLEIEALELERTAAVLGLSPAATTALHLEARAGLRAAYRQARLDLTTLPGCADCAADLGAFGDDGLTAERTQAVRSHLDECPRCTADHLYLQDTEAGLRGWLLPVLAGVPLWDTRTDELGELIRTAGRMSAGRLGAAPGTDVAGGALAAVHVSRRGRKVLLGAGALAAAAALAGVAVTGSGGLGDGTTQASGRVGGSGTTPSSAAAPPTSSGTDDAAATVARGPGAAVPGRAGGLLSLPTTEPSPGPLTEAAAEARTARAGSATLITAATEEGSAAGAGGTGAGSGASTGRGTGEAPHTQKSALDDGRAPRSAASRAEGPGAGSSGAGSPGASSADGAAAGGGGGAPASSGDDGGTSTGGAGDEQPPAPEAPAPGRPAPEVPAGGTPVAESPATETPAAETPEPGAPVSEAPVPQAPLEQPPASEPPAAEVPVPDVLASQPPAAGAPAPGSAAPAPGSTPPAPGETAVAGPTPGV
ncbi:zf-HC2 domain-containing protein [uncultured Kocuria sp.]|uniref:zf-HC2 domain-containing protein n=1 Tax=uncultured Kocuria sp. TaxID=259305 RepID=UPI00262369B9|nr:zf-HC2 domain-containing protein [uncultured Kocuria sp.]